MDTGTDKAKHTLMVSQATVRSSQWLAGGRLFSVALALRRPERIVACLYHLLLQGNLFGSGGKERLVEFVKVVSVDKSSRTDFQC